MFRRTICIGALLLLCAAHAEPATAQLFEHSNAIVVGIDNYQSPSRFLKLSYAVKDAQAITTYLRSQGYDKIFTLYNEQATKEAILEAMNSVARRLRTNDRVLVFFAGHGYTEILGGKDRGYIVPFDGGSQSASLISMDELENQSSYMGNARHQLFIMDSCYGGLLSDTRESLVDPSVPNYLDEVSKRVARQVITAGGPLQQVLDVGPNGHSFFVDYLLEALQDGLADLNKDGYITFDELKQYLIPRASNHNQTPSVGVLPGHGAGEYLFKSPIGAAAIRPAPVPAPIGARRGGTEPSDQITQRPTGGVKPTGTIPVNRPPVSKLVTDAVRFPSVILECECGQCEHGGGGAVWVFEGQHGQAMWRYGAVADLAVEKFDGRNFTIRRVDPVGSYSSKTVSGLGGKPFTAIYTGTIDGNRHVAADVSYNCKLEGDAPEKPCNSSAACPLTSDQVLELGKNAANAGLKSAARQCFRMAASMGNSTAKTLVDYIPPDAP